MKTDKIIDALITKITHDLINPIGSIQMAFEENEPEFLAQAIQDTLLKVDMFRFLYKSTTENELQTTKLMDYLKKKEKNVTINHQHKKISALLFFLSEKMLNKSEIIINENNIELNHFFFNQEEVDGLNGTFQQIETANILLYLSYLQYIHYYKTKLENKENNKWIIQLIKV